MRLWIFDLDGTLVDTSGDIVDSVNELLAERSMPPRSRAEIMGHVGSGTPYLMARILDLEPEDPAVVEATRRFIAIYSSHPVSHSSLYPGTRETLEALASTCTLVVISNKAASLVRATLEAIDLVGLFTHAWGGGEFGALKPAPDGIIKAIRATGIPKSQTTVVGDMPMDMTAGRRAGVRTLFAAYGFGRPDPDDPEPDGIIKSFSEIVYWA